MPLVSDYINSSLLDDSIKSNCPYYRKKFAEIAMKAGVNAAEISDQQSLKKLTTISSFNWAGLFFGPYWAIYRKIPIMGWGLFALIQVAIMIPALDKYFMAVNVPTALFVGFFGNGYLMRSCINNYSNTTSEEDRDRRSPMGLAIALGLAIIQAIFIFALEQ